MASVAPQAAIVNADTLITVKVAIDGSNRRFKLALRDLGAHVFPQKLRFLLAIPPDATVVFERYSDSAGAFVRLDSDNTGVYKQLYRAAKAKLKLRIKATVTRRPLESQSANLDAVAEPTTRPLPPYLGVFYQPTMANTQPAAPAASVTTLVNTQERSVDVPPMKFELPLVPGTFPTSILNDVVPKAEPEPANLSTRPFSTAGLPKPFPHCFSKPSICLSDFPVGSFCIDCNNCNKSIPDVHYHCSICDDGDFDLCQACVDSGILCGGEGHWLIKRFIQDGKVINSTTETIEPRKIVKSEPKVVESEKPALLDEEPKPEFSRTCNACVGAFEDSAFVTCLDCDDYDLCVSCHLRLEHGHHPGHTFKPLSNDASFGELVHEICKSGRGMHHYAICDGCDKHIVGVRHKCLTCPDWDYCSCCIQSAKHIHPGHRFAPIYEPIAEAPARTSIHYGIYCDGPLCKSKPDRTYIMGDRYKCAVCHDTDFCANCEAVPVNRHNRTHPLIKFRTPVRNVSVTTLGEKGNGERMAQMGDRLPETKSTATETTPAATSANAATQVHTVAEVKPVDEVAPVEEPKENPQAATVTPVVELQALFICDLVPDGSEVEADKVFDQVWTLRNPGPSAWPAGCSVRFVGGDAMLNVDSTHPSSVSAICDATETNVIGREVQAGEEIDFRITLKAPQRLGKAISYWRLKSADGTPFGHKVWADINVVMPKLAALPETEHIEDIEKEEASEALKEVEELHESAMIFPKLDKESPMSSTHEASTAPTVTEAAIVTEQEQELLEDVESLELEDEETDDGFLTDEEYDILDASDEEYLAEAQKSAKK